MNRFEILAQTFLATMLCLGSAALHAEGRDGRVPTPAELLVLPPYCKDSQIIRRVNEGRPVGRDEPIAQHWFSVLGENFWDIHHYCFALNEVNRAQRAQNTTERTGWLSQSLGEFDYVLKGAKPGFILLPEILTKKGEALIMLGRDGEGAAEFEKTIEIKPDYWAPYAHLSDYYKEKKNLAKAREILEQGLKAIPNSKGLLRRKKELEQK